MQMVACVSVSGIFRTNTRGRRLGITEIQHKAGEIHALYSSAYPPAELDRTQLSFSTCMNKILFIWFFCEVKTFVFTKATKNANEI
ncbi:hypothetical protein CEXT_52831 [Caerostris extrusa]|uniref:Uncharacterized protein n=1 Tax=Caerostris extrusa TaxID=172846 RepID=A0AAV4UKK8_CAEEX|nr:hypothetical protein CEXT_52831 [Caerostris extrusa]